MIRMKYKTIILGNIKMKFRVLKDGGFILEQLIINEKDISISTTNFSINCIAGENITFILGGNFV